MISIILFMIFLGILASMMLNKKHTGENEIPGPKGLLEVLKAAGMIGIPFLGFHKVSQKFGNILNLDLVTQNIVILAGYEDIKAVHSAEAADDRAPIDIPNSIFTGGFKSRGILLNSGPAWRELRRFTIKTLKDLGINKSASEDTVLIESKALVEEIRRQRNENNGTANMDLLFNKAVLNVVWKFVSNQRYEYDDHRLQKLMRVLDTFMTIGTKVMGKPLGIFSFLRFIPPFRTTYLECYNGVEDLRCLVREAIKEHQETFDKNDMKDFIDMFLNELGTMEHLQMEELVICCVDLFIAGSETSSKGLLFAIALMIRYPEVQKKIQDELDEVMQDRPWVTLADKPRLPYTEATINEVMRYCNVVPVVAPRMISKDLPLKQYTLKKGTTVITNTYSVHMDPAHWKDPEVFRPERFLKEGVYVTDDRNIPFGIGRRRCLGEGLARMENFLFFANLLRNFRFLPEGDTPPSIEPVPGFSNGPEAFKTTVQERF